MSVCLFVSLPARIMSVSNPSTFLQKVLLRYYLFEGMRYIWLDRKGAFCRVRYLDASHTYGCAQKVETGNNLKLLKGNEMC